MESKSDISSDVKSLLCFLVRKNPEERFSARQALEHKWFSQKIKSESNLSLALNNMSVRRSSKRTEEF